MKQWIIAKCLWLLKRWSVPIYQLPTEVIAILSAAREEVSKTAAMDGLLSNEYRHAHTYATLMKRLPGVAGRHIGLAIEMAINER